MWFRKEVSETHNSPVPDFIFDLINHLDEDVLLIGPGDKPIFSSNGIESLNVLRDGRVLTPELSAIVRAVRRTRNPHNGKLEIARGPIGEGTRELTLKVVALEDEDLILILISDESEAQRVHEVRRDFVANISHELKTPIGALSILAEAVLEASDDPTAIKKFASRMQIEATRLSELVQEVINLSRLQDEDPLKNAEVLDVASIAREAIDESRLAADKQQIEIVMGEHELCYVLGDKAQLRMAMSNLIKNAINYSPSSTRVGIGINCEDDLVEFSVTDQGVGIPEKDLERIFERFYRVDPARSRETGGTGLGLSIVKHVASNHGGDISVWSLEGQGSTFTLRLPRVKDGSIHPTRNEG